MKELDCRGLACPQPVITTKKALDTMVSDTLITIVDNETARENVSLFARNAGCGVSVEQKGADFYITITKGEETPGVKETVPEVKPAAAGENAGTVYFISSNVLGQGSPDLGMTLMKSLMNTLSETDPLPGTLIFLNSGVYLTCEGSVVLEKLLMMGSRGVKILSCGTCLEYYKLKEKLQVGIISNMYDINNILTGPGKVITVA
ncbi:hypothetical protein DCCM_2878 [Desulfocucumis palustris]|uniref:UPF0033 domain-containing protein n=1 Tax=Desulfocucumis palustris TaxID=1898651 RepID=A0A2L2XC10_9FIRM|nr:sulfurtransferase-like selenium metabolism protein YedF [Desulfocucumis palustris]GBF33768.1 hypothetical protein DCCM_2878 [Desulfocucumis palustris]